MGKLSVLLLYRGRLGPWEFFRSLVESNNKISNLKALRLEVFFCTERARLVHLPLEKSVP
jgi:hypothetical protein